MQKNAIVIKTGVSLFLIFFIYLSRVGPRIFLFFRFGLVGRVVRVGFYHLFVFVILN